MQVRGGVSFSFLFVCFHLKASSVFVSKQDNIKSSSYRRNEKLNDWLYLYDLETCCRIVFITQKKNQNNKTSYWVDDYMALQKSAFQRNLLACICTTL